MRVVKATGERTIALPAAPAAVRTANIEALGLWACSVVVLFGLWLTTWGRLSQLETDDRDPGAPVDLRLLRTPDELARLLTMFESPLEAGCAEPLSSARCAGSGGGSRRRWRGDAPAPWCAETAASSAAGAAERQPGDAPVPS